MWILTITLLIAAGVCFLLAHLIGTRRQLHLLAGYNPDRVADPIGLARLAGRTLTAIGSATIALLVTLVVFPRASAVVGVAYVLFIVAAAVYLTQRGKRYAS